MPTLAAPANIVYPDSDGKPMADNTLQWEWIATVKGNIELLVEPRVDVFVAGDNLIYPVEGNNVLCLAPDVYVAFGRPKGHRGSYKVWAEGGIFPQIVFEVLSPNTKREMAKKRDFYEEYGAEEYYVLDPERTRMSGFLRADDELQPIPEMIGWVSPRLGIRFTKTDDLELFHPDGRRFLSFVELGRLQRETVSRLERASQLMDETIRQREAEQERADREQMRADHQRAIAEAERVRAEKLAAKLRELGVDPDA
jgi:Uma2 family endonuclease